MDQRRGRAPHGDQDNQDLADIQNIMSSIKTDGSGQAPAPQHSRQRPAQSPAAGQGWAAQQAPRQATRDAVPRKEAELRDKEDALRRGTQLLMDQRAVLQAKEDSLKTREGELRKIAGDLEKQARRVAEREAQVGKDKKMMAEDYERHRLLKEKTESMERDLAGREQRIRALESDLKLREQHLLAFEQDIKECPYCNVRFELEGVRELMDELRGFGIDMSGLDRKYEDAMNHMKKESYDMALDSTRGLLRELKAVRDDVLAKGIRYVVAASARTVASACQNGQDTSEADRLLAQARAAVDKKQYRAAEHLAKEAEYIARDLLKGESSSVQLPGAIGAEGAPAPAGEEPAAPGQQQGSAAQEQEDTSMYPPPQEPQQPYESMYPPPQEEAPPEEEAPPASPSDKIYNCSSCFAAFKIGSSQRPVRVTCRSCGNSMIISE